MSDARVIQMPSSRWSPEPPLIGENGLAHHVEFDPRRGHRCLPDCLACAAVREPQ